MFGVLVIPILKPKSRFTERIEYEIGPDRYFRLSVIYTYSILI